MAPVGLPVIPEAVHVRQRLQVSTSERHSPNLDTQERYRPAQAMIPGLAI